MLGHAAQTKGKMTHMLRPLPAKCSPPHRWPCSGHPFGFWSQQLLSPALSPASRFSLLGLYRRHCAEASPASAQRRGSLFGFLCPSLFPWDGSSLPLLSPGPSMLPLRSTVAARARSRFRQSSNEQTAASFSAYRVTHIHYRNMRNKDKRERKPTHDFTI